VAGYNENAQGRREKKKPNIRRGLSIQKAMRRSGSFVRFAGPTALVSKAARLNSEIINDFSYNKNVEPRWVKMAQGANTRLE
jgi:hypothetical protein